MSVKYRSRNQYLLGKVQSAEGVEASPTPASDAIRAIGPQFTPNLAQVSTDDEVTGSLSSAAPLPAGGTGGIKFGLNAGSVATPGTNAPEVGVALRGCSFSETKTAAAVTGTAQAGGAQSITLAVGASAVTDAYKGMVIRLTGGTGTGQVNVISAYNGTTKVATVAVPWANLPTGVVPDVTSAYSLDANVIYKPVSTNPEYITWWAYQNNNDTSANSRRRRVMDSQGTFSFSINPRDLAKFAFTFMGTIPANPDDVAAPSTPTYSSAAREAFLSAQSYLGGASVKFNAFSLDLGGQVQQFDDPSSAFGYDSAQITTRKPTGRIVPNKELLSTRDLFNDWKTGTPRDLWLRWGSAAGKRVSLYLPALTYTDNQEGDVRGFATEAIPFQAAGNDAEMYWCFH
jgi:hypothetical protein